MKRWLRKQIAKPGETVREVIKIITNAKVSVALIVDENDKLLGYVSDSDIRRAILNEVSLDTKISEVMVKNPVTVPDGMSEEDAMAMLRQKRINRAPVIDAGGILKDLFIYTRVQDKLVRKVTQEIADDWTIAAKPEARPRKKVLVIGAGGYVGSVVCRELLNEGYEVRGIDRFLFGEGPIQEIASNPNFEMVTGDILNLNVLVDNIFGVDAVINLAAIVGDPACDLDVNHTIMVNYFSSKVAADIAKHYKVDRYLFASTAAVYGASSGQQKITETGALAPVSLYAETKLKSEQGILSLMDRDFSPCVFRLSTVYGYSPRMRFDLVVNLFILQALTDKRLTVFGGEQWRPYVHVQDIARALVLMLKAEKSVIHGQIFNLGSNEQNLRVIDLAQQIANAIPGTELTINKDNKDQRDYYVGFDKIKTKLHFEPSRDIQSAIDEIKAAFERGEFKDFKDKKYNNMRQQEHLIFG